MREVIPTVRTTFRHRPASGRDRRHLDGRLRRLRPGAASTRGDSAPSAATPPRCGSRAAKRRPAPSTTPPTSTATTSSAWSAATPMPSTGCGSGTTTATPIPSASTTKASSATCEADGADLSAHTWDGGHDGAYWDAPLARVPALLRKLAGELLSRSEIPVSTYAPIWTHNSTRHPQRPGDPAGGVPGGGAGPQLSRPSVVAIGIFGPAMAGVSRVTSATALTRESTSRTSLFRPW